MVIEIYPMKDNTEELAREAVRKRLFFNRMNNRLDIPMLPRVFLAQLRDFVKRNSLANHYYSVHSTQAVDICCERCLKAYALELAGEMGLSQEVVSYIDELFDCETGHEGYYLDSENLVKVGSDG